MNTQFTITLNVDISKISEVYEALQLVNGVHIGSVESSTAIVTNGNGNGDHAELPAKPAAKGKSKRLHHGRFSSDAVLKDPRAVLIKDGSSYKLDTKATLKKMGLTEDDIRKMVTPRGRLERSVKCSLLFSGKPRRRNRKAAL